jgi:hypothetical protein
MPMCVDVRGAMLGKKASARAGYVQLESAANATTAGALNTIESSGDLARRKSYPRLRTTRGSSQVRSGGRMRQDSWEKKGCCCLCLERDGRNGLLREPLKCNHYDNDMK